MPTERIDSRTYRTLLAGGLRRLADECDQINKLNVFPVPDGDTGDNMLMTLQSGLDQTAAAEDMNGFCESMSKGMLYGARGNSGVILSRFFFGMNSYLSGCGDAVRTDAFVDSLEKGVTKAYEAVSSPKEGTMLTVMRETAEAVKKSAPADFEALFRTAVPAASESLERTPEQLEVLKNAGVVDSGGAGFLCILDGMRNALEGSGTAEATAARPAKAAFRELTPDDEMLGYCTEFILQRMNGDPFSLDAFRSFLESVGNSVVAFEDGNIVKVHVHTFRPEEVLAAAHRYGEFLTLKIENMTVMHSEPEAGTGFGIPARKVRYGLLAVANGDGVRQMLERGGCTVVDGGRSMNPSAEEILRGVRKTGAETVFVFPNHKNVFLAAEQAKAMCDFAKVIIVRSEDVGQCYHAIACFDGSLTEEELTGRFGPALTEGGTVHVARAIRSCVENGISVTEGDWICFDRDRILVADATEDGAVVKLFEGYEDPPDVVIGLYGEEETEEGADALGEKLSDLFPDTEFIMTPGGQPVYRYTFILS